MQFNNKNITRSLNIFYEEKERQMFLFLNYIFGFNFPEAIAKIFEKDPEN